MAIAALPRALDAPRSSLGLGDPAPFLTNRRHDYLGAPSRRRVRQTNHTKAQVFYCQV